LSVAFPVSADEESAAKVLRTAREGAGLTQREAADLLGVTEKTVSRWETGSPVKRKDISAALTAYQRHADSTTLPNKKGPEGSPGPRYSWARVTTLERVRAYLRAFGDELHALGATPDEEDEAVRSVRDSGGLAYNAERFDWTEDEAIQLMEVPANGLRRYFKGLKRRQAER
jgi:transcriptional regulator with XRE-family HTH domain